jgi:predicted ester cyclase
MNDHQPPRMALGPSVVHLLDQTESPEGAMLSKFLRYGEALLSPDPNDLDAVVAADACLHDLDTRGLPPGLAGLKVFRNMINAAFPDERAEVLSIELEQGDVVVAEIEATGTHRGELMGIAPTGRVATWRIHTRIRFEDDKVVERWDRVDVERLIGQLTG